jgi:hypothetical protein
MRVMNLAKLFLDDSDNPEEMAENRMAFIYKRPYDVLHDRQ